VFFEVLSKGREKNKEMSNGKRYKNIAVKEIFLKFSWKNNLKSVRINALVID